MLFIYIVRTFSCSERASVVRQILCFQEPALLQRFEEQQISINPALLHSAWEQNSAIVTTARKLQQPSPKSKRCVTVSGWLSLPNNFCRGRGMKPHAADTLDSKHNPCQSLFQLSWISPHFSASLNQLCSRLAYLQTMGDRNTILHLCHKAELWKLGCASPPPSPAHNCVILLPFSMPTGQ